MVRSKCKVCENHVSLRKNDVVYKLSKKGKKEHLHAFRVIEQKNGLMKLELMTEEKTPKSVRKKMAEEVVNIIEPQLKEQVAKMIEGSLVYQDKETLELIKKDIEKGKPPELKSRPGCVYLQTSKGKVFL